MTDHKKVCWYCDQETVEPFKTWYKCRECGSTHTIGVTLGPQELLIVDRETGGKPSKYGGTMYRPTASSRQKSARIRQSKIKAKAPK